MPPPSTSRAGSPTKKKADYKPLQVDHRVVEKLRTANQVINNEAELGINFNRKWKALMKYLLGLAESNVAATTITLLTMYSLFSTDIKNIVSNDTSEENDNAIEIVSTIIFVIFLAEILILCLAKPGYFEWPETFRRMPGESRKASVKRRLAIGSFFFYLDLLGTFAMLGDFAWVVGDDPDEVAEQVAVRVGRAGRIARLMRMIRLLKLDRMLHLLIQRGIKLFEVPTKATGGVNADANVKKDVVDTSDNDRDDYGDFGDDPSEEEKEEDWDEERASKKRKKRKKKKGKKGERGESDERARDTDPMMKRKSAEPEKDTDDEQPVSSLVGATMTDLTYMRVIIVVLTMLIVIPLLTVYDADRSNDVATAFIHTTAYYAYSSSSPRSANLIYNIGEMISMQSAAYIHSDIKREKEKIPIMSVMFNPSISFGAGDAETYSGWTNSSYNEEYVRASDKVVVSETTAGFTTTVTFDNRSEVIDASQQGMLTTGFIIFLLFFGTYFFTREVNRLVIDPIESMVALVTKISENPLGVDYNKELGKNDGFIEGMETTILLNTINKIGGLMRVGFGEAGASIIADNLKNAQGARLNLMTTGRMINSIFGFCDVRQFTDTTECLQEEVMLFVNRIAHILHSIVNQCSGSANKNIGDAFLLTWKLEDDMSADETAFLADSALVTFCKALVELGRYQDFICNFSNAANERLYKRFPGYLVRIGSGLHVGWAIEGAIGSNRKIDASYLSPHVNFTEFLESSTKAYGVPLLISEPFYNLLSPEANMYVRQVDRIRKPGEDPVGMYTYDSDLNLKWPKKDQKRRSSTRGGSGGSPERGRRASAFAGGGKENSQEVSKRQLPYSQMEGDAGKDGKNASQAEDLEAGDKESKEEVLPTITLPPYTHGCWERDQELIQLRHVIYENPKFRPLWDTGIAAYLSGDWPTAHHVFNDCLDLTSGRDGPSKFLINVIDDNDGNAPDDWNGYRDES